MTAKNLIELTVGETVPVSLTVRRNGVGVSVSGATITFSAIWLGEYRGEQFSQAQPTTVTSGATVKIDDASCTADADQSTNPGLLTWTPTSAQTNVSGHYAYQIKVTFVDGTIQFFPRRIGDPEYRLVIYPAIDALA